MGKPAGRLGAAKIRQENQLLKMLLVARLCPTLVKFQGKFGSQTCRDLRPLAASLLKSHMNEKQTD